MKKVHLIGLLLSGCTINGGNYVVSYFDGSIYKVPVYSRVDLDEARSALTYLQSKVDKNEYFVDISSISGSIAVRTHVGIPDKDQPGKSGSIYYLQKTDSKWIVQESVTWIE